MQQDLRILQGDCRDVLRTLPDQSVNCVVTSPPYWGLRDYGVDGQIGQEPTPLHYVATMVQVFAEVRRVLADDGTLWLNLGDAYASDSKRGGSTSGKHAKALHGETGIGRGKFVTGIPDKNLIGLPWLVAFALQADGWILRQDIIWSKENPMSESVKDRPSKSHEYIFLFSKSPRYYFDFEAVQKPAKTQDRRQPHGSPGGTGRANGGARNRGGGHKTQALVTRPGAKNDGFNTRFQPAPLRRLRSVWSGPCSTYRGAHFATMPEWAVQDCILAGCPVGGVVLDPFGGSGTTGRVALTTGRRAVLIELNPAYIPQIEARTANVTRLIDVALVSPATTAASQAAMEVAS